MGTLEQMAGFWNESGPDAQAALAEPAADPVDAWQEENSVDANTQPEQSQATA